jgi:hypothetical protein
MSELCVCDKLGNTGLVKCQGLVKDSFGLIFQPIYKADGAKNFIDLASLPISQATMTGWVNATDKNARMYPTGQIRNFTTEREEPNFQDDNNGSRGVIRQGSRSFNVQLWEVGASVQANYETFPNVEMGFYIVSNQDAVTGLVRKGDKTKAYPIPLQAFYTLLGMGTGEQKAMLTLAFDMNIKYSDSELITISGAAFEGEPTELRGLINFDLKVIEATETALVVEFVSDQGYADCLFKATSVLAADMTLLNVTDESPITITSASEDEGTYTIGWDSGDNPTVGDILKLSVSKDGGDYTAVAKTEIEVTSGS